MDLVYLRDREHELGEERALVPRRLRALSDTLDDVCDRVLLLDTGRLEEVVELQHVVHEN